jgi:ABC-type maltose transport system permease subunit
LIEDVITLNAPQYAIMMLLRDLAVSAIAADATARLQLPARRDLSFILKLSIILGIVGVVELVGFYYIAKYLMFPNSPNQQAEVQTSQFGEIELWTVASLRNVARACV